MAFLYADSWESLSVIGDTSVRGWTNNGTPVLETTIIKDNTNSIRLDNAVNITRPVGANNILFTSFWIRRSHVTQATFFRAIGNTATDEFSLRAEADDTIDVMNTTVGGTPMGSSAAVFTIDVWHHIEFKCRFNDSNTAADIVLKVNGVTEFSNAGGEDTLGTDTTIDDIEFESGVVSEFFYIDSPVFWNEVATDDWDDFKGMLRIEVLFPDADGTDNEWDGSDGNQVNNFELVDDPGVNDGVATFVESNVLGNVDLYNYPSLTGDIATIAGVFDVLVAERSSGPARSLTNICLSGATEYPGTEDALVAGSYDFYGHMWDQDPDTAAAWLEAGVNAAEFGVEVTT
jgi:hypothetical protein